MNTTVQSTVGLSLCDTLFEELDQFASEPRHVPKRRQALTIQMASQQIEVLAHWEPIHNCPSISRYPLIRVHHASLFVFCLACASPPAPA